MRIFNKEQMPSRGLGGHFDCCLSYSMPRLTIIRDRGQVGCYANFASSAWETSFTLGVPSTSKILTRDLK